MDVLLGYRVEKNCSIPLKDAFCIQMCGMQLRSFKPKHKKKTARLFPPGAAAAVAVQLTEKDVTCLGMSSRALGRLGWFWGIVLVFFWCCQVILLKEKKNFWE